MKRALLAALFVALPLHAALGPEIAIPLPPLQPAMPWHTDYVTAAAQPKPALAPLGDGFVAAWTDSLTDLVQIVGRDGTRSSDMGVAVAKNQLDGAILLPPVVASRGDSAAIAYTIGETTYVEIVHADGTMQPGGSAGGGLSFLAANADGYLLVLLTGKGASGVLLDAAGKPAGSPFAIDGALTYFAAVASNGADFLVVTRTFAQVKTWLVTRTGIVARGASFPAFEPVDLAATWDGSQYVVAWTDSGRAHVAALESDATLRSPERVAASGAVRDAVSSGDGATIVTEPPHFVRFARATLVPIASGDLGLPDIGAVAQNGVRFLISGGRQLSALLTDLDSDTLPVTIAFAPRWQSQPRVATGSTLSFVLWSESSGATSVVRMARFTRDGIIDVTAMPPGTARIDASGYRTAIAGVEGNAITLRTIDSLGGLSPPEILAPPPATPGTYRTVGSAVITPTGTAVVWSEWNASDATLRVTFDRGPTVNLGHIDFSGLLTANAAWDGSCVVVATVVDNRAEAIGVAPDGVRWRTELILDRSSELAVASNHAGPVIVTDSGSFAILDAAGKVLRTDSLPSNNQGSAAFDGGGFLIGAFRKLVRIDVDGNYLTSVSLTHIDDFGPRVAPGAIAYTANGQLFVRSWTP